MAIIAEQFAWIIYFCQYFSTCHRWWSALGLHKGLVANYGERRGGGVGLQNGRGGGQVKFYPYTKGGGGQILLAMLKWGGGGCTQSFEGVLTWELKVLAIVMGGVKSFHLLKGGGGTQKVLPSIVGGGGGQNVSDLQSSCFVAPPPPPSP